MATALQILKDKFGYEAFRFNQEQIIETVLNKQDAFYDKVYHLTAEQEASLEKSLESPSILVDTTKDGALDKFLNKIKKEYV